VSTAFGNLILEEGLARCGLFIILRYITEILRICVCLSYCNK
jgi:hypothetical protein